eukprot:1549410-Karenia_brevis.AAC.1
MIPLSADSDGDEGHRPLEADLPSDAPVCCAALNASVDEGPKPLEAESTPDAPDYVEVGRVG